jgi:NAD(P)-dependent dehydrogenase (short-subunit alcohol dehydrogenase family)
MANKLALVTGASSGIGLSLAQEVAGCGYDIVLCSADGRLNKVSEELREASTEVLEVQADLDEVSAGTHREGVNRSRLHHLSPHHTDEAPEMYKVWRDKKDHVTKIVIDPWREKAA